MPKIVVSNITYNTEDLSQHGLSELEDLNFAQTQIDNLICQIGIYEREHKNYIEILKTRLEAREE